MIYGLIGFPVFKVSPEAEVWGLAREVSWYRSYLTPVAVVAHEALAADAVPHVLASAHLCRALGTDLVAAGVHLPTVLAEVDVLDPHVLVELATPGRVHEALGRKRGRADDASDDDEGDGDRSRRQSATSVGGRSRYRCRDRRTFSRSCSHACFFVVAVGLI